MAAKRTGLARARRAAGHTQERLAQLLGIDTSTVARWESGQSEPSPHRRPKLARLLRVTERELEGLLGNRERSTAPVPGAGGAQNGMLVPVVVEGRTVLLSLDEQAVATHAIDLHAVAAERDNAVVTAAQWGDMSPLDRRSLLKHGLAIAALPALGLEELQQVAAARADARRYFDRSVLDYFKRQLAACKADDGARGPRRTLPIVLGLLAAIEEHAGEVKPQLRRELLAAGAEGAEFAAWLYRDVRDFGRSLYWYDRATEWAQEAGDGPMQGYVLLKKAQLAFDEREPVRMLTLAQAAQQASWSLPKRVQAEAVQQEARAEVMVGATADAVRPQLDRARELLDEASADDSTLGAHYSPRLLTMQTAICFTEAGAPRQAVDLYEKTLREDTFSKRDYGFFLSFMAGSLALAGEPDQAARTGLESFSRARATNSDRTKQQLVTVLGYLRPWQHRPAVRELHQAVAA
ncbi:helix-turn-helix domain-containing protein [Amycolatopsis thermoflava]|uniref:helix-turn-helix domain-containing protein n=1 Tax=Amycolatopsis thermoflava TaxID=84480 RepID=UPI0037F49880